MNSTRQVNPLARLKLSVAAASLVLAGSWAILAQNPIASAHDWQTGSTTATVSESTNTTQSVPWDKLSSLHKHQAARDKISSLHKRQQASRDKHIRKMKEKRLHTPWSQHSSVVGKNKRQEEKPFQPPFSHAQHGANTGPDGGDEGAPFWTKFLADNNDLHPHGQAPQQASQDSENNDHSHTPPWLSHQSGDQANSDHSHTPPWLSHQFGDQTSSDHSHTSPWLSHQPGDQANSDHSHTPPWLSHQSGDQASSDHSHTPPWLSHQSGDQGNNETSGSNQPSANDDGNTDPGQAPFWTKFLAGKHSQGQASQLANQGSEDTGHKAPFWTKFLGDKNC
jgi:hypothetical protein